MDINSVIDLSRMLIFNGLQVIAPALIVSLVVAVIVGIVQAVMQIQEQTLSFFPKLISLFFVFYYLGPWMFDKMINLVKEYVQSIPGIL